MSLKVQKRLAASLLKCGKKRIWLDPLETQIISSRNSRHGIRKLVKDGIIVKQPTNAKSRYRIRKNTLSLKKGRHSGVGKRKGKKNARTKPKQAWIDRLRVLRRLLQRYRSNNKIDKHLHRKLYLKCKGNAFKNKRVLMEYIFRKKKQTAHSKMLTDQAEAKRAKGREARKRREERIIKKKQDLINLHAEEDAVEAARNALNK
ncbi:60S ribosomal protein L19-like [Teleopsis dalmanni]|uniref:60S ribosomal protein L19-like n=1 Tax=Teleopsis dalmanni TaxID=139649 RepID=UPI000D329B72|nr:60S ribosomal protein L19-like [Teleopsis dalmanni]XP_037952422.1 60S ribosomal protein L19-like [Teleopsis dalmanni]